MKNRFFAAMLLAALSIAMLTGCAASATSHSPKAAADPPPAEQHSSAAPSENTAPDTSAQFPAAAPTGATVTEPVSATASLITEEEAIAIALADAGFAEDQVTRLRTEFDWDDRRPEFEVDFHRDGYEYEYEIHAETGAILSKDIDRED